MSEKEQLVQNQESNQNQDPQDPVQNNEEQVKSQGLGSAVNDLIHPSPAHWKILVFEFFGTLIFAHGIVASNGSDFLVALSLFAALILTCQHSGGHINPAVSTGFLCLDGGDKQGKAINTGKWLCYVVAQLFGAFCGGYTANFVLEEKTAPWIDQQPMNWVVADVLGEFLGTFTFVLTILIMTDKRTSYNTQTIYILLTITAALFFSRQFSVHSGGCLNPAIALGLEAMMYFSENDSKYLRRSYVYVIGPICGAVAAGCFYRYFWQPKKIEEDANKIVEADKAKAEAEAKAIADAKAEAEKVVSAPVGEQSVDPVVVK